MSHISNMLTIFLCIIKVITITMIPWIMDTITTIPVTAMATVATTAMATTAMIPVSSTTCIGLVSDAFIIKISHFLFSIQLNENLLV